MQIFRAEYRLCYAHRVWDHNYSFDDNCRLIHGHTADLSVVVKYDNLDPTAHRQVEMTIEEVLGFMNAKIFNRFIIDHADPMFYTLVASLYECLMQEYKMDNRIGTQSYFVPITVPGTSHIVAHEVNLSHFKDQSTSHVCDILKSYFITDFCPSTSNLAKWFYDLVNSKISKLNATLEHVAWSSTPNRKIIYQPQENV